MLTDDGRTTDAGVIGILIAHLGAFGSGELKTGDFSLVKIYLRPSNNSRQLIFNINAVVLIDIIC